MLNLPLLAFLACSSSPETPSTGVSKAETKTESPANPAVHPKAEQLQKQASTILGVLPDTMPGSENDTLEKIALGKKLYFDKALSINDSQSCNSCHDLNNGNMGVDHEPTSPGAKGERGGRNSPTSVNAGFHIAQFWDGRAGDLKAQAKGPILNPGEMAMPDEETVMAKLSGIVGYPAMFRSAFPEQNKVMTYDNLAEAIAAFERTLISRDRFDTFQNGDLAALNEQELRGLEFFVNTGCVGCHNGATIGGSSYQKVGVVIPYMTEDSEDIGRAAITGNEAEKFFFKVPSLRNVAKTAPYFHDGEVPTLEEAVSIMAEIQLGKELNSDEVDDIVAFLNTMNGEITF